MTRPIQFRMNQSIIHVLVFIVVSLASQTAFGSSVKIDVTTQYRDGVIPNAFNIRCTPQTDRNCAISIVSIQLIKDNDKNIANIQGHDHVSYNRLLQSSLVAEGHIDRDITKTYLSVTIKEAVKEDSGMYSCAIVYFDDSLKFQSVAASYNVTVTDQDTQDIIKHLMSKVSFLENLVQFQQVDVSEMKTKLVDQGAQLQSQIDQTKSTVMDNSDTLAELIRRRENTTVLFMAIRNNRVGPFSSGQVLVFEDVVVNEGGGYDKDSGVFTAPISGYYMMHLSLLANDNKHIYIDLKSSNDNLLARMKAGRHKGREDYSDASFVAKLDAGEQVRPVIKAVSGSFTLYGLDVSDPLNKFYGYLLKTV